MMFLFGAPTGAYPANPGALGQLRRRLVSRLAGARKR